MIDLKLLENNYEKVKEKLLKKNVDEKLLEETKILFEVKRPLQQQIESLQAKRNSLSKEIGNFMRNKEVEKANEIKKEVENIKNEIVILEEELNKINDELTKKALSIPNIPDDDVPVGVDENDNVEIKKILTPREFDFEVKPHDELGVNLDWLDFERGVKLAKSRFTVFKNEAARLERALINYMLDFNRSRGYEEFERATDFQQ
jgi:seryl-tRNA synthetase